MEPSWLRAARRARVRAAVLHEALRRTLLRARWRRARRRVSGVVVMAKARLAQRQVARAVRADKLLSTVQSNQRSHFRTRRAAAARPRLMSAARVGPVVWVPSTACCSRSEASDGYG